MQRANILVAMLTVSARQLSEMLLFANQMLKTHTKTAIEHVLKKDLALLL
jgi:hypothetical protein